VFKECKLIAVEVRCPDAGRYQPAAWKYGGGEEEIFGVGSKVITDLRRDDTAD
jgi:hypothetical protein